LASRDTHLRGLRLLFRGTARGLGASGFRGDVLRLDGNTFQLLFQLPRTRRLLVYPRGRGFGRRRGRFRPYAFDVRVPAFLRLLGHLRLPGFQRGHGVRLPPHLRQRRVRLRPRTLGIRPRPPLPPTAFRRGLFGRLRVRRGLLEVGQTLALGADGVLHIFGFRRDTSRLFLFRGSLRRGQVSQTLALRTHLHRNNNRTTGK